MQTMIKVCVSRSFLLHSPNMHKMNNADFMHTFCRLVQNVCRERERVQTSVHMCNWHTFSDFKLLLNFLTVLLIFAGPTWCQRDGSVLIASRRFDCSSRKTKGSLADTLQCNIYRRAQTPHLMTHCLHGGDNHGNFNGFTALGKSIGTPMDLTEKDAAYVMENWNILFSSIFEQNWPPSWEGCLSFQLGTTVLFLRR